jgi:hypothetical protein
MYICPISGCRLVKAQIKGGLFWYSPESDGRYMSISTVKHFLGDYAASEIWMRSENGGISRLKCPGCKGDMVSVSEPAWVGAYQLDVCRKCWMVWVDREDHPEIPHGSDIDPKVNEILKRVAPVQANIIGAELPSYSAEPDHFINMLPGLFLPTKTVMRGFPFKTVTVIVFAIIFHNMFVYEPGINRIFFGLNLYFFYLFSSDLEIELSHLKYFLSLVLSVGAVGAIAYLRGFKNLGLDLMPTNLCLMMMAIFLPLHARFSYLFPSVHYLQIRETGFISRMGGLRWIHLPQWFVVVLYIVISIPWHLYWSAPAMKLQLKIVFLSELVLGVVLGLIYSRLEHKQRHIPIKWTNKGRVDNPSNDSSL